MTVWPSSLARSVPQRRSTRVDPYSSLGVRSRRWPCDRATPGLRPSHTHAVPLTRVLALSFRYPPHHVGGYELSTRDVLEELARRGHDIEVLVSDLRARSVPDPAGERDANPAVHRDLRCYFLDDALYRPSPWRRWMMERHNQRVLAEAINRFRPEIVAPWQMSAMSLSMLTTVSEAGIPMVYAISDDWLTYGQELDAWSSLFLERRALGRLLRPFARVPTVVPDLGRTGRFLFNSEVMLERSERFGAWSYPDRAVVYVALDTLRYPIRSAVEHRRWTGRMLYAGRMDPRKGIETAVRALAELDDTVLEVRGTGDAAYGSRLRAVADEVGVGDRLLIEAPRRDGLADRYEAADVVVFPSEWEEPFGLVPVEAMACGTPVVATGVGGSAEYLEDGVNCLLFTPGDSASLALAVRRLRDDADLRRRLVVRGEATARRFELRRVTDSFEHHYVEMAGRP